MTGELLDTIAIIFGDEEIYSPYQGIAIKCASCITCNVDIAASINCNSYTNGFSASHTQLLGVELDTTVIVFGDEEIVSTTRHGITIKPASCITCNVDIAVSIGRNSGANGYCTSHAQLLGVELDTTVIVFGDVEIVSTRQGITIKPPCCRACNVNVAAGIGANSVAIGYLISHA